MEYSHFVVDDEYINNFPEEEKERNFMRMDRKWGYWEEVEDDDKI